MYYIVKTCLQEEKKKQTFPLQFIKNIKLTFLHCTLSNGCALNQSDYHKKICHSKTNRARIFSGVAMMNYLTTHLFSIY